ncbi:COX15/CtaA family protein [Paenibacillus xerothermodurans]|uniref:Heme A synthase n=1 Tax=Paenibacillus xerothermodurans TaxID=1977292 RepID=A0A2W1N9H8_PAEXE|nr:COX15/CtaA family protein [Paenibacillus xerothermodurans]PZE21299.1 heme A synthase [Paenibacillus xerothermodurans]
MSSFQLLKRFSFASMYGMFLILVMGALVTKTESGRGCGDDWPLCNGRFIPAYTIESFIEYSHRFVVGVVGVILLITTVLVFLIGKRADAKWYVSGAMFFTVLQAILGAMAVVWPQSSAVLALHFGFSLISFAFTLLLALVYTRLGSTMTGAKGALSGRTRGAVYLTAAYSYAVVYLGAFVRHTESSGGCMGWPLCNGQFIPELNGATGIVFVHRVGAVLLFVMIAGLFLLIRADHHPEDNVYQAAKWSLILIALQILSGAFVTFSLGYDLYLVASLLHAVLISCLFGVLCYLCVLALQSTKANGQAYAA